MCAFASGCWLWPRHEPAEPTLDLGDVPFDGIPRIRPGIVLMVQVSGGAEGPKAMEVQVDQNGEVTLNYLLEKSVNCDKMTIDEFKQKLVAEYKAYIRQPVVTVNFIFDTNTGVSPYGTVLVLGEVANPGPINLPATGYYTVTKVLKLAGGTKPFAKKSGIRVTSCDKDGNKTSRVVNLYDIGQNGDLDKDIALHAGDIVWVPEQWY